MTALTELKNIGEITNEEFSRVTTNLVEKLKDAKIANAVVSEIDTNPASANTVKDEDVRTILLNTFDKNLDGATIEIFNSTWGELNKFLSLNSPEGIKLDNLAAVESAKANLNNILPSIENRVNTLAFYVQDEGRKQEFLTQFNEMKQTALENVSETEKSFNEQIKNQGMLLVASLDNLSPDGDKVNLSPEAITVINGLDATAKDIRVRAINGEDLDIKDLATKLFGLIIS